MCYVHLATDFPILCPQAPQERSHSVPLQKYQERLRDSPTLLLYKPPSLIHIPQQVIPFLQSEEIGKESESFVGISRSWDTGNEPIRLSISGHICPSPQSFSTGANVYFKMWHILYKLDI